MGRGGCVVRAELVYDKACPNVESARTQLLRAFAKSGVSPRWHEWDTAAPETPDHARGYGSPTILVDGRDVSGEAPGRTGANCCRIYAHGEEASSGVPALADIVRALSQGQGTPGKVGGGGRWQFNGALIPAIGVALLPKLTCPACWPAYAGLLGSLGIGFFDYTPYLLPLTAGFLLIAIAGLAYRARARRGYRPLMLGLAGSAILSAGKFGYDSNAAMYVGIAVLVAASVWNTWPPSRGRVPGRAGQAAECDAACHRNGLNGGAHGKEATD